VGIVGLTGDIESCGIGAVYVAEEGNEAMLLGLLNVSDADVSCACEGSGSKLFVSIRISGLRSGTVSGSTPLKLFRKSSQLDRFSTLDGEKSACNVLRRRAFSSRSRARVCASSLL